MKPSLENENNNNNNNINKNDPKDEKEEKNGNNGFSFWRQKRCYRRWYENTLELFNEFPYAKNEIIDEDNIDRVKWEDIGIPKEYILLFLPLEKTGLRLHKYVHRLAVAYIAALYILEKDEKEWKQLAKPFAEILFSQAIFPLMYSNFPWEKENTLEKKISRMKIMSLSLHEMKNVWFHIKDKDVTEANQYLMHIGKEMAKSWKNWIFHVKNIYQELKNGNGKEEEKDDNKDKLEELEEKMFSVFGTQQGTDLPFLFSSVMEDD